MRITSNGKNDVTYVAFDSAGEWARSSTPHLLVLADWDADNNLIGLAFGGPLAPVVPVKGIPAALALAVTPAILDPIVVHDSKGAVDHDELKAISDAVNAQYEQHELATAA